MARQKKSKLLTEIMCGVLLLLLIGSIEAILHFTDIGKDDIVDIVNPTFRVVSSESVFKPDGENIFVLPESGQVRFEVKGTNSYTVAVLPNVTDETDFTYSVNDKTYQFGDEADLSYGFDLKCYDSAFTINAESDYTLVSVLSKLWGIENITVSKNDNSPVYKLVVTSSKGEVVDILLTTCILGITLPENIIF